MLERNSGSAKERCECGEMVNQQSDDGPIRCRVRTDRCLMSAKFLLNRSHQIFKSNTASCVVFPACSLSRAIMNGSSRMLVLNRAWADPLMSA